MLRHLVGLLAGIALAPVLWIAVAWATGLFPRVTEGETTVATVLAAVVLCLVGMVGAYLVAGRLTPVLAGTSGALLTALCLWPAVAPDSPASVLSWVDADSFLFPAGTALAVALPLGILMFCSAMVPTRWRRLQDDPVPAPARVMAGTSRDRERQLRAQEYGQEDGGARGTGGRGTGQASSEEPVADTTVADDLTDTPPVPLPPPHGGDPDKTTTPFRRGETGAVWTPLDDDPGDSHAFGDNRR